MRALHPEGPKPPQTAQDGVMAALLSVLAALCCCCVNFWAMVFGDVDETCRLKLSSVRD